MNDHYQRLIKIYNKDIVKFTDRLRTANKATQEQLELRIQLCLGKIRVMENKLTVTKTGEQNIFQ